MGTALLIGIFFLVACLCGISYTILSNIDANLAKLNDNIKALNDNNSENINQYLSDIRIHLEVIRKNTRR